MSLIFEVGRKAKKAPNTAVELRRLRRFREAFALKFVGKELENDLLLTKNGEAEGVKGGDVRSTAIGFVHQLLYSAAHLLRCVVGEGGDEDAFARHNETGGAKRDYAGFSATGARKDRRGTVVVKNGGLLVAAQALPRGRHLETLV
jgi:hypothetical protein